jgi:cation diffusion facilitator family transporter
MNIEIQHIKIKTMKWVLIIGAILMCIKFLTYFITNSSAILTDAFESVINVMAGSFALFSLKYAAKPKDEDHPYGHGKIEFLSGGIEGALISVTGISMMIKGLYGFIFPQTLNHIDIGVMLSIVSGTINFILAKILIKKGSLHHSTTMVAEGKHLLTDTWSSIGLVLGLTIIYFTNWVWIDNVITIFLGAVILFTGIKLIKESILNLLDTTDYSKIDKLLVVLNKERRESWIDIHNLRILKYGAVIHVDCHMTLPWYYNLQESHKEVDDLDALVKSAFDQEIEFFIHTDPCLPKSCSICLLKNCKERQQPFVKKIEWTNENILPDAKHST